MRHRHFKRMRARGSCTLLTLMVLSRAIDAAEVANNTAAAASSMLISRRAISFTRAGDDCRRVTARVATYAGLVAGDAV